MPAKRFRKRATRMPKRIAPPPRSTVSSMPDLSEVLKRLNQYFTFPDTGPFYTAHQLTEDTLENLSSDYEGPGVQFQTNIWLWCNLFNLKLLMKILDWKFPLDKEPWKDKLAIKTIIAFNAQKIIDYFEKKERNDDYLLEEQYERNLPAEESSFNLREELDKKFGLYPREIKPKYVYNSVYKEWWPEGYDPFIEEWDFDLTCNETLLNSPC